MFRWEVVFGLLLFCGPAIAHDDEAPIQTASELRDWCQHETGAFFVGKGQTPHNWRASYIERGNAFHVAGKWRVDSNDVEVECSVARGAQRRYANFQIHE